MRIFLLAYFALLGVGFADDKAPVLAIAVRTTGPNEIGGTEIFNAPEMRLKSGQQGVFSRGPIGTPEQPEVEYKLSATLLGDEKVRIEVQLLRQNGKAVKLPARRVNTQLGWDASFVLGEQLFTTKVELATQ